MPENPKVALLAEGVDRNAVGAGHLGQPVVALLAEGVDRNALLLFREPSELSRPPRGGRG